MGLDRPKSESAPEGAFTETPTQAQPPQEPSESAGTSSPEAAAPAAKVAVRAVAGEEGHVKVAGFPEVDLTSGPATLDADHAHALLELATVEAAD